MNKFTLILMAIFITPLIGYSQFVENKGQVVDDLGSVRNDVLCTYQSEAAKLFFMDNKIKYALYSFEKEETDEAKEAIKVGDIAKSEMLSLRIKQQHIDFNFLNANKDVQVIFRDKQSQYQNFYLAHCPKGITNVPVYKEVLYKNIYNNIDILFKETEMGLKYDIILHKGAKLSDVKFQYDGIDDFKIVNDEIVFHTQIRDLVENIPLSFISSSKEPIDVEYNLGTDGMFGFSSQFEVAQEEIIIDPVLSWATIFENGVTGGISTIRGDLHVDATGNFYQQLNTYSANLPIGNPGGLVYVDPSYNPTSGLDIFFAQYDVNRNLIWSTYLGGTGNQSSYYDHSMGDYNGSFFISGVTNSNDFPVLDQGGGAYYVGTAPTGQKAFLSKFNIGTGQMQHSTYLRTYGQIVMDVSSTGNVAVASTINTSTTPNVMSKAGAYNQATNGGTNDVFLYVFNSSMVQTWGTYVGGPSYEETMGIQYDKLGNLFLLNRSAGAGTPTVNPGGGAYYDNTFGDKYDFWIVKFNATGAMTWSTYFGGDGLEGLSYSQVTCNDNNEVILTSTTRSTVMSLVNQGGGAYFQTTPVGLTNGYGGSGTCAGFIMKFNNNGVLLHSTYMGENNTENYIHGQALGNCNQHYFLLMGRNFSTTNVAGSYNVPTANTSQNNYLAMQMNSNFGISWASYLHADSIIGERIATDLTNGRLYASGLVQARNYPFTNPGNGAYFDNSYGSAVGRAGFIMDFDIGNAPNPTVTSGAPSTVCAGTTVSLTATGNGTFNWYTVPTGGTPFATGSPVSVSPTSTTTYYVESVIGGCASPRSPITITVTPAPAAPIISSNSPVCVGGTLNLTANTISGASYIWSGPALFNSILEDPTRSPVTSAMGGTYNCYVVVAGCTSAVASTNVIINTPSIAPTSITGTSAICSGSSTTLTVSGGTLGTGATAQWYSGSCGGTLVGTGNSITVSPTSTTTYYVRYSGTCNTTSCASQTVTVNSNSTAPTSITGTTTICSGSSTTLTVNGGTLGTGATAQWFSGSCGGTLVGTGNSITVSPTSNTTYFVRYNGTCNTTTCISQAVTVNSNSTAPTSITGTSTICSGSSTTLTVTGGTLGTGATVQWYLGSCGGALINTGNSITVAPTSTTTYYVRYVGTCNTTVCISQTVTVTTPPNAGTLSGNQVICSGSTTTFSSTQAGGTWTSSNTGTATVNSSGVVTGQAAGTATITYTVTGTGGCSDATATRTVTVTAPPNAGTLSGTQAICEGSTTTFSTTSSGGTWSSSNTGTATVNSSGVVTGQAAGTATITYTVTGTGGCSDATATRTVTVTAPPNAGTLSGTQTICEGSTTTFSTTSSGGTWSSSNMAIATVDGSGVITGLTDGTATITYTVTGTGGCSDATATRTVTVNSLPTVTIPSGGVVCEGATLNLAPATGGTWTSSNPSVATITNGGVVTGVSDGTANMVYTETATGCSSSAAMGTITVNPLPTFTVSSSNPTSCGATDGSITVSGLNASTSYDVSIGSGALSSQTTNAAGEIVFTGLAAGSYSPITISLNNCSTVDNAAYDLNDPSSPTITVPSGGVVCAGESLNLTPSTGGTWASSNILVATITNGGVVTGVAEGTANMIYTETATGCSSIASTGTITVIALPVVTIPSGGVVCEGATLNLSPSTNGTWTSSNPSVATITNGGVVTGVSDGTANMVYTETATGCSSTATMGTITVDPLPTFTVSLTNPSSCGTTDGSITVSGLNPSTTYDVSIASGSLNSQTTNAAGEITFSGLGAGGYSPIEVVLNGCSTIDNTVYDLNDPSLPTITVPSGGVICEGETLNLMPSTDGTWTSSNPSVATIDNTGLLTGISGGTTTVVYTETASGCSSSASAGNITVNASPIVTIPAGGNVCEGATLNLSPSTGGTWLSSNASVASVTNAGVVTGIAQGTAVMTFTNTTTGCTSSAATGTITVNTLPTITVPTDNLICEGASLNLEPSIGGTWSSNDVSIATITNNGVVTGVNQGTTEMIFTNTATGCSSIASAGTVNVNAGPILTIGEIVCNKPKVSYSVGYTTNAGATVSASIGNITNTAITDIPNNQQVIITATTDGCPSISETVFTNECIEVIIDISNGVSPNNDGLNDFFTVTNLDAYPNNKLMIFNRWGDQVYESGPYENDWNGQNNTGGIGGEELPAGTYFYILELDDDQDPIKGYIELKK